MKPRISDGVAVTVPIVVLLVAVVIGVLVATNDGPPPSSTAALPPASPDVSGTPADRGTPGPRLSAPPSIHTPRASATAPQAVPTATSTVCVPQEHKKQISVLTFNIHSARDHQGGVHLGEIGDELARWDPDVVLLQEVDRGRAWTGRVDMPSVLADRLDMAWTFGANVRRSATNLYGTAILSRFPIVSSSNTLLPDPPGTQQRGLLHAVLDLGGMKLSVYDTHLESTSYEARTRQIQTIMPILRADPRPKLLGGDFNSAPTSPVLGAARSLLADTWPAVGQGESLTVPASNPRIRIDYLLYGSGDGTTVAPQDARVLLSQVSDHRAVLATYRLSASSGDVCVPVLGDGSGGSQH